GMEFQRFGALGTARVRYPPQAAGSDARIEPAVSHESGNVRSGFPLRGFRMGRLPRLGKLGERIPTARGGPEAIFDVLLLLHARPAKRVRVRRAGRGLLRGDPEYGFGTVRRVESGEWRTGVVAAGAEAQ